MLNVNTKVPSQELEGGGELIAEGKKGSNIEKGRHICTNIQKYLYMISHANMQACSENYYVRDHHE